MPKFWSTLHGSDGNGVYPRDYSGRLVAIVRPLVPSEADEEVGRMYLVKAADGVQFHAFERELGPNPIDFYYEADGTEVRPS